MNTPYLTGLACGSGRSGGNLLSLDRAPANVAPAEAVGPADKIDSSVSTALRLANTFTARAYVQHASAIRKDAIAIGLGAGVKDLHAVNLRRGVESFNERTFGVISRVTIGRDDHRECRVRVPAQIKILQLPVARGQQRGDEIGHQAQHEYLAFGIAEANIVFDQLGPIFRDHQAGEQHAFEWGAGVLERAYGGMNDFVHHAPV